MKLFLLNESTEFSELVQLIRDLGSKYEIVAEAYDEHYTFVELFEKEKASPLSGEADPPS